MAERLPLLVADRWRDYRLLDCGGGLRLERWGDFTLVRPDPQIIWPRKSEALWNRSDACYRRDADGGGEWEFRRPLPEHWLIRYRNLTFKVRPTGFKHMGLFPEQAVNWDWFGGIIRRLGRAASVLNLFGYTGGATVAAAAAGAAVCHVDAAKGIVQWCRENAALCGLERAPIRYIVDDCPAFVKREARRGRKYDAIIMDPPVFGRGKRGEVWKLEDRLWDLLHDCRRLLSGQPAFFLVNSYTAGISPVVLVNLLADIMPGGRVAVTGGELGLPVESDGKILPCGVYARWQAPGQPQRTAD